MNNFYDYKGHVITIAKDEREKAYYCTILAQEVHQEVQHDYVLWSVFFHETHSTMTYVHKASKCFTKDYKSGILYIGGCTCIDQLITSDGYNV